MTQIKGKCKFHPDRQAVNKCFYWKEPVCSSCRKLHAHHYFCSISCYFKWRAVKWAKRIRPFKVYIVLIAFVLLSDLVLFVLLKPEPAQPQKSIVRQTAPDSFSARLDTSRIELNYGMRIELEMNTGSNPVLLWQNGRFVTTAVAQKGKADFGKQYFLPGLNRFTLRTQDAQGISVLLDSFSVDFHSSRLSYLKKQVSRIYTSDKVLSLTFDGGSSDKGTRNILDTLRSRNVHCTMFLTGGFIHRYPDLVKQILADGHEPGNHSFDHPHLTNLEIDGSKTTKEGVTRKLIWHELLRTDSLFKNITGRNLALLWRAPFGELNENILLWAAEIGYKHVNWSLHCDSWDWVADTSSQLYRSPQLIFKYFLKQEGESGLQGRILLMHLGSERKRDFPYSILGKLIDALHKRGYRFVTVNTLIKHSGLP